MSVTARSHGAIDIPAACFRLQATDNFFVKYRNVRHCPQLTLSCLR